MTKVKICGITNLEDALVAIEAGADLLGFIFYEPSPRYVRPEVVREIVSGVRCRVSGVGERETKDGGRRSAVGGPTFVGVFVNSPLDTVAHLLNFCQLDAAQLHGEESPEFVGHFGGRAFKALRPQSLEEAAGLVQKYQPPHGKDEGGTLQVKDETLIEQQFPNLPTFQPSNLPTLLLDAYHPNLYGGTGQVADWEMAAIIAQKHSVLLAGSLTAENVAEAVRVVRPWGVDVSSGVEKEKGRKDHKKVRDFIAAAKSARG